MDGRIDAPHGTETDVGSCTVGGEWVGRRDTALAPPTRRGRGRRLATPDSGESSGALKGATIRLTLPRTHLYDPGLRASR